MIPIDEQIKHQQNTVKIIEDFDDKESLPKEQAILASLERLKAIESVQVPDVDIAYMARAHGIIDTLCDMLRREIENREHLASMMFDDTRRAEAAESKLAAIKEQTK